MPKPEEVQSCRSSWAMSLATIGRRRPRASTSLGFRGLVFGGLGLRVQGFGLRVNGPRLRIEGLGLRVYGFWALALNFWVVGLVLSFRHAGHKASYSVQLIWEFDFQQGVHQGSIRVSWVYVGFKL